MVMQQQLAALAGVVALALLALLLEPAAAAGVKFSSDDLDSDESLWQLYERWGARYNVARDPVEKLRRFDTFKETGSCGSCWAFAATGALESYHAIRGANENRAPLQLSEQELVDCDATSDRLAVSAFHMRLSSSASYPYRGVNGYMPRQRQHRAWI